MIYRLFPQYTVLEELVDVVKLELQQLLSINSLVRYEPIHYIHVHLKYQVYAL